MRSSQAGTMPCGEVRQRPRAEQGKGLQSSGLSRLMAVPCWRDEKSGNIGKLGFAEMAQDAFPDGPMRAFETNRGKGHGRREHRRCRQVAHEAVDGDDRREL